MKTYTTEDIVKASSKGLMHNIEWIHKETISKDIQTAKRCLNFQGYACDNDDCLNSSCPLHIKYRS